MGGSNLGLGLTSSCPQFRLTLLRVYFHDTSGTLLQGLDLGKPWEGPADDSYPDTFFLSDT